MYSSTCWVGAPDPRTQQRAAKAPHRPVEVSFSGCPATCIPSSASPAQRPPNPPPPTHTHFYPAPAAHWAQALVRNWSLRAVADVTVPPHPRPSCPWLRCSLPPILLTRVLPCSARGPLSACRLQLVPRASHPPLSCLRWGKKSGDTAASLLLPIALGLCEVGPEGL